MVQVFAYQPKCFLVVLPQRSKKSFVTIITATQKLKNVSVDSWDLKVYHTTTLGK